MIHNDVTQQRCVILGRVGAAYGIKGWFHLHPFADDPEAWQSMPIWWISTVTPAPTGDAPWRMITPESMRVHGDGLVIKLTDVNDRNAAEALRGCWLGAPRETLPVPEQDTYYWDDLMGQAVVNLQGELLGRVDRLIETGANAVLIVIDTTADKPRERLIPFVGNIVHQVDKAAGQILVDWAADW